MGKRRKRVRVQRSEREQGKGRQGKEGRQIQRKEEKDERQIRGEKETGYSEKDDKGEDYRKGLKFKTSRPSEININHKNK